MHRATLLERKQRPAAHMPKGPLPHGAALHFGKPGRPPLALRRHHGKRRAAVLSHPPHRMLSDDGLPCRGADCSVWGDLAVALLFLALFGLIVYVHALLPAPHP